MIRIRGAAAIALQRKRTAPMADIITPICFYKSVVLYEINVGGYRVIRSDPVTMKLALLVSCLIRNYNACQLDCGAHGFRCGFQEMFYWISII